MLLNDCGKLNYFLFLSDIGSGYESATSSLMTMSATVHYIVQYKNNAHEEKRKKYIEDFRNLSTHPLSHGVLSQNQENPNDDNAGFEYQPNFHLFDFILRKESHSLTFKSTLTG